LESNKNIVVIKDNEDYPENVPAPSAELKDIASSGVSETEGDKFNQDDNIAKDTETDSYAGKMETSHPTVEIADVVSISKQSAVRGSRTPGASAPNAVSNSNIANAEVAAIYDKSKSKKQNTAADPYSHYKSGDYVNALQGYNARLISNRSDLDAMFHVGMCLYHLKRYDEALTNLSGIPQKGNKFSDEALYYIGQTYEQKGDIESAISAYNILVEGKSTFSSKASKRIKTLEGR